MKLAVINTGGTISCCGSPLAPMPAKTFAEACRQLINPILNQKHADLTLDYVEELRFPESSAGTLDSTNLQPGDWCLIAGCILNHYADYDGWVILHGTDSLAFSGTALGFLLSSFDADGIPTAALGKPVIITGSQLPMFYRSPAEQQAWSLVYNTDALQNFCGAVAAAQSGIPEVCVYFHQRLYRGNRVLKTSASDFNAFSSPNYPPLAEYGLEWVVDNSKQLPPPINEQTSLDNPAVRQDLLGQLAHVAANIARFPVMPFKAFPAGYDAERGSAMIAELLTACVGSDIKGLILEAYGSGNFPSGNPDRPSQGAIYRALHKANADGVVIVDCTQVISGMVDNNAYAAGAWLPAVGALSPADMTPIAAFVKLMLLLTIAEYRQWQPEEVKKLLQLNLLGEMRSVSRLDGRRNAELVAGQALSALDGSAVFSNDPHCGPLLSDSSGRCLWTALPQPPSAERLPGRLLLQNDGRLVFYDRCNVELWSSETGDGPALLMLEGSASDASLSLSIFDYTRRTTMILFRQTPSNPV